MLANILSILAPYQCIVCDLQGDRLCQVCSRGLARKVQSCHLCNCLSPDGRVCIKCRAKSSLYQVLIGYRYEGAVKELIQELKYSGAKAHSENLAKLLFLIFPQISVDVVSWVPAVSNRYRLRGYNQAEQIAKRLAEKTALPYQELLGRQRGQTQIGKTREQRLQVAHDGFYSLTPLSGVTVLLVDDVISTGATLEACAHELKLAGAKRVIGLAVAKH